MAAHDGPFGWIHSLKLNSNNVVLGSSATSDAPYPPIIVNPSFKQVMKNWNKADTSLFLIAMASSTLLCHRVTSKNEFNSIFSKKQDFFAMMAMSFILSFTLAARNSFYRLEGLVPNGLKARKISEPVKYDYTSTFVNNSFLSFIYEGPKKPTQ